MNLKEKSSALVEVVKAYLERGNYIQYDQRCMDRALFLTPRRMKLIPPEAATAQKKVYLDCSSYVGTVFYEAFGYELPSDLTWHMIDYVEPRIFYYELTHNENEEEKAGIEEEMRSILQVGDVITYDRGVGSGHTMLYIGDSKFTHCTPNWRPDSYDYINRQSREYEDGGLFIADISSLFNERLFLETTRRVAISRPLLMVGEPTQRTIARLNMAKGLCFGVETSHSGMVNAKCGETVEYRLKITETAGVKHKVNISFELSETAIPLSETQKELTISAGESTTVLFKAKVIDKNAFVLKDVKLTACGMDIFVPWILIGNRLNSSEISPLLNGIEENFNTATSVLSLVSKEYKKIGISIEESEQKIINKLFYLHDAPVGDVLSRRAQNPLCDGAVYSFFGGTSVITPEMISYPFIRTNQISRRDFLAGDIIVISDDANGSKAYSLVYTGNSLIGKTEFCEEINIFRDNDVDKFFDSLLGRFCFIVLRPSLLK